MQTSIRKPIGTSPQNQVREPMEDKLKSVVESFLEVQVDVMGLFAFEVRSKITMIGTCLAGVERKSLDI